MPQRQSPARVTAALRALATLLLASLVALTLVRLTGWGSGLFPLPALLAFTPEVVVGGAALAAAFLLGRRRRSAAVAAICVAALSVLVAPRLLREAQDGGSRAFAASGPAVAPTTVRITTFNTKWGHADFAELTQLLATQRSDVVALQEISADTYRQLAGSPLLRRYPHVVRGAGQRWDEVLVLSRWPAQRIDATLPTVYRAARLRLPGAAPLIVVSAHPTPPVRPRDQARWERWLADLPSPDHFGPRAIVAGDFNATLDHPQFRDVLATGWRDAALLTGNGLTPTWHGLPLARLTIDHLLVTPGAQVDDYRVDKIDGSDHSAVTATVTLPPAG